MHNRSAITFNTQVPENSTRIHQLQQDKPQAALVKNPKFTVHFTMHISYRIAKNIEVNPSLSFWEGWKIGGVVKRWLVQYISIKKIDLIHM